MGQSLRAVCLPFISFAATTAAAVSLPMVPVGNLGNTGELSGYGTPGGYGTPRVCGAVDYRYSMGKFEVTAGEYTAFLNAVARSDTYGLYNTGMWSYPPAATTVCKIARSGASGNYSYSVAADYANRPVNFVSWGDAARFCNWLANGQPTGGQNLATTEDGSYHLNGATSAAALIAVTRKPGARWVIPSEDEWYKAAYHKNDGPTGNYWEYPTASDTAPGTALPDTGNNANTQWVQSRPTNVGSYVNSPSPCGTFDQGGNIWEWTEAVVSGARGIRGGSFNMAVGELRAGTRMITETNWEGYAIGFRVAEIPEPGAICLMAAATVALACSPRRRGTGRRVSTDE